MMIVAHPLAPVSLGLNEWGFVALASVIIFAILGRKIVRELKASVE